jgi:hypothetical protein
MPVIYHITSSAAPRNINGASKPSSSRERPDVVLSAPVDSFASWRAENELCLHNGGKNLYIVYANNIGAAYRKNRG